MEGLVLNETEVKQIKPRAERWRRSDKERALGCPAGEVVASETVEEGTELDELVSIARLARRWDCSPKSIRNNRSLGKLDLPAVMIGRLVRFRLRDIMEFEVKNLEAFRSKKGPRL
jgi:hypothetical protein